MSRKPRSAVGLDIGTSAVRAAEVSWGRGGPTVTRLGQVALAPGVVRDGEVVNGEAVAAACKKLWAAAKIGTKDVVLGVANQSVIVRQVELPWLPADDLAKSLRFQVADLVPMPVDEAVLDFVAAQEVSASDGSRALRGLLVAASEEMVMRAVDAVTAAGLNVKGVDLTPFAVLRTVQSASPDGTPAALVDIGARITSVVVHDGGLPRFVRILRLGAESLTDAIVDGLGISYAEAAMLIRQRGIDFRPGEPGTSALEQRYARAIEGSAKALVEEIRGSLDYYSAGASSAVPQLVVVAGGGARIKGLPESVGAASRLPVTTVDTAAGLEVNAAGLSTEQVEVLLPLASAPIGLALGVAS